MALSYFMKLNHETEKNLIGCVAAIVEKNLQ